VIEGRPRPERDVGPYDADQRRSASPSELPEVLVGSHTGREPISVRLDGVLVDDDDRIGTELGNRIVLGRRPE
jgi:hypothetical protein